MASEDEQRAGPGSSHLHRKAWKVIGVEGQEEVHLIEPGEAKANVISHFGWTKGREEGYSGSNCSSTARVA